MNPAATPTAQLADRAAGAVWGLAFGDAIGDPQEFRGYDQIMRRSGPDGPTVPAKLRVTDDTQMSLAVWHALDRVDDISDLSALRRELVLAFLAWERDPDNNRAPGGTCLAACAALRRRGVDRWEAATVAGSKGCGANMRAPWIALHPRVTSRVQAEQIARMQAALTHGHPVAVAAAAATTSLVWALAHDEITLGDAPDYLLGWARWEDGADYDHDALGDVWRYAEDQGNPYSTPEAYIEAGADAVWAAGYYARRLRDQLQLRGAFVFDPCSIAGGGWVAEEALAVAAGIAAGIADHVMLRGDGTQGDGSWQAEAALRQAAATDGDSDSIGAIAGALVGAAHGTVVWPRAWASRIERRYQDELGAVVTTVETAGARQ